MLDYLLTGNLMKNTMKILKYVNPYFSSSYDTKSSMRNECEKNFPLRKPALLRKLLVKALRSHERERHNIKNSFLLKWKFPSLPFTH